MYQSFMLSCVTALAVATDAVTTGDVSFKSLGQFKISEPAFINMSRYEDSGDDFLLISQFSGTPWAHGSVSVVTGIKDAIVAEDLSKVSTTKLDSIDFKWPNDVKIIPFDVFEERAIVVPDGFLVPGHKNGGVYVIRMDQTDLTTVIDTVKISPDLDNYFYHMGEWIDMNGDGRKDFIIARSNAEAGGGRLVWFEHPEGGLD